MPNHKGNAAKSDGIWVAPHVIVQTAERWPFRASTINLFLTLIFIVLIIFPMWRRGSAVIAYRSQVLHPEPLVDNYPFYSFEV